MLSSTTPLTPGAVGNPDFPFTAYYASLEREDDVPLRRLNHHYVVEVNGKAVNPIDYVID